MVEVVKDTDVGERPGIPTASPHPEGLENVMLIGGGADPLVSVSLALESFERFAARPDLGCMEVVYALVKASLPENHAILGAMRKRMNILASPHDAPYLVP